MISGGLIGGGQTAPQPAPTAPAPATPVGASGSGGVWTFGSGPGNPIDPTVANNFWTKATDILDRSMSLQESQQTWNGVQNLVTSGLQFGKDIMSFLLMEKQFNVTRDIYDRRAKAEEHISDNQKEWGIKYLEYADAADARHNSPDGINERLARIQSQTLIDIRQRELESKERIAAMRDLDERFGLSTRPDYTYGYPVYS